ncbi:MAG: hypothetical protein OXU98_09600, partial [Gammaproteobacteria bacterium]|nr:hypothetical protein [Gammaproteobacteria bacterium]
MNRGRLKLALIFAAFLGPLLAAFAWYYGGGDAAATRATTNHAPLLAPPLALRGFANPAVDGGDGAQFAQFNLDALKRRWTVVHLLPESCAAECRAALYNTRQARLALGRDAPRVRRVFIAAGRAQLASLAAAHPDATRLLRAAGGLENQLIPLRRRRHLNPADALLIDPLGNVMLVIPATLD